MKKGYTHSKEYLSRVRMIEQKYSSEHGKFTAAKIRNKIEAIVEDKIWTVWVYVREHRNRLDSDRICNHMKAAIEVAVDQVKTELTELQQAYEKLQERNKKLEKQNRELRKELKDELVA